MQPRAFVVMPFGKKPLDGPKGREINFGHVYDHLLEPALRAAGCDTVRADQEEAAGDIRTDMFFELVTADFVVADVTIPNPNVFYELGIRDGVCPRGIFLVNGDGNKSRPFDIAPDRTFGYDARLFTRRHPTEEIKHQCQQLTKRLKDAIAADRQTIGSPVYSHLPGLKAVNWDDIQTSKTKYFDGLQEDWRGRIRSAQSDNRPGDILTLAANAPTRQHEARILYDAATALVALCRHQAAERVLRDVIQFDPDNADAQIQLALVLCHLGRDGEAEGRLRELSSELKDQPEAADSLGQVLRHLWHLTWKGIKSKQGRRHKAIEAAEVALSAVQSFLRAHRADPRAYFAGFNALMLIYLLQELGIRHHELTGRQLNDLTATTRYVAQHERERAIASGLDDDQFWSTTTLAGILLIDGKARKALREIKAACAIPAATAFQLQTFHARLELLLELGIELPFVNRALDIVDDAIAHRNKHRDFKRVFLWKDYRGDSAKPNDDPFSRAATASLEKEIASVLAKEWAIREGDLAICGGSSPRDIVFAEQCLKRRARVWFLMRRPLERLERGATGERWPFKDAAWRQRFQSLRAHRNCKVWLDSDRLGNPVESFDGAHTKRLAIRRHQQWLLNTAEMEAEPVHRAGRPSESDSTSARLYGLFYRDGQRGDDESAEFQALLQRVREFNNYQGNVKVIPDRRS
jgi:hypothetical protein